MTPEEYEHHVAEVLSGEGWETRVTPHQRDHGVDIIAERNGERLAVQAKMFGGSNRSVAGKAVMELCGAARYADCETAMIATYGRILPDAAAVAEKLGVEIRLIPATATISHVRTHVTPNTPSSEGDVTFGKIWAEHIVPLAGTTLTRPDGKINEILSVDDGGLERRTSNGRPQRIEIEIFRRTIERLLDGQTVTRDEVNEDYTRRASSGILLILGQVPLFEATTIGRKQALRCRQTPAC